MLEHNRDNMTQNPRNAGRKPVPDGVLVKTTVPKNKVKKLKDYSKQLIKEYHDETTNKPI